MEFQEKKALVERIGTLSKEAHIEIFFLLKKYVPESHYTLTRNGAFFNLNQLSDKTLTSLKDLVEFCSKNEENLQLTHPDKKNVVISREELNEENNPSSLPKKTTARKQRVKK